MKQVTHGLVYLMVVGVLVSCAAVGVATITGAAKAEGLPEYLPPPASELVKFEMVPCSRVHSVYVAQYCVATEDTEYVVFAFGFKSKVSKGDPVLYIVKDVKDDSPPVAYLVVGGKATQMTLQEVQAKFKNPCGLPYTENA